MSDLSSRAGHSLMKMLQLICRSVSRLVKRACSLPKTIANAIKQRQRQSVLKKNEAERLDRICNPSKYRGK